MRILFVGLEYDYGDASRGPSFEAVTFVSSLKSLGHDVDCYDAVATARRTGHREAQEALLRHVATVRPDVVFCVLFKDEVAPATLGQIRDRLKTPIVNWFCDDHWRYREYSRHIAPALTLSVTTAHDAAALYAADHFPFVMSQWGYPTVLRPTVSTKPNGIAFVGQVYGARARTLRRVSHALRETVPIAVYGFGAPLGRLDVQGMANTFASSIAILNFSDSWAPGILSRLRHRQLRIASRPRQVKARVFEVTGCGGVLVTQTTPHLDEYFELGREVLAFGSERELILALRELAADAGYRDGIARAGQARCLAEHTMEHRLADVLRHV